MQTKFLQTLLLGACILAASSPSFGVVVENETPSPIGVYLISVERAHPLLGYEQPVNLKLPTEVTEIPRINSGETRDLPFPVSQVLHNRYNPLLEGRKANHTFRITLRWRSYPPRTDDTAGSEHRPEDGALMTHSTSPSRDAPAIPQEASLQWTGTLEDLPKELNTKVIIIASPANVRFKDM